MITKNKELQHGRASKPWPVSAGSGVEEPLRAVSPSLVDESRQQSLVLENRSKKRKFTTVVGIITVVVLVVIWVIIGFLL